MKRKFKKFMEEYKNRLTDTRTLEELLGEAKNHHRVQKLLIVYMLKDKETFQQMLSLAVKNSFADKLVKHCRATMHDLSKTGTPEEKKLMLQLNKVSCFSDQARPEVEMEEWEASGYKNMFQRFLFEDVVEREMTDEMRALEEECLKALD